MIDQPQVNVRDLIGLRILATHTGRFSCKTPEELKVLEVSPSGQWVKLMSLHGNKYWKPVSDLALVEVLIDLAATREDKPHD